MPHVDLDDPDLAGMDGRIDITSYGSVAFSVHHYVTVDGTEVHRVLTEGDAARLNRGRREPSALRYRPLDTYHGFDTVEQARAAGEAALVDLDGDRVGYDETWPRILLARRDGSWEPLDQEDLYELVDERDARADKETTGGHRFVLGTERCGRCGVNRLDFLRLGGACGWEPEDAEF